MQGIRWGIIGCGDVTEVKSGPGFQKAANSRLVAVMRRSGRLARDYAERHGVPKWYDRADDLIADPEVDAVYIATPPANHKEYTLAAARAGKPVYVEKPMALTFAECQEMLTACRMAGVPLFVAYYRRSLPRFLKVKELLDAGAIGDVRAVQVTHYAAPSEHDRKKDGQPWRVDPAVAGGGYFYDMACHTLDLLDYFFGPVEKASGYAANQAGLYQPEDIVAGSFTFAGGVVGSGLWCFSAHGDFEQNLIVGTRGQIAFSSFADAPIRLVTAAGEERLTVAHPPHVQQPLIEAVVTDLLGGGKCPSTGESGARTSWVIEQLVKR